MTNTVIDNNRNYTGVAATFANMTITGDLTVEGTTTTLDTNLIDVDKLEIGANNSTVGAGITQSGSGNILNLYDDSSLVFSVEDGGRIVGTATSSVIPFLHPTLASLPNAGTYHGAFAHVHSEGKGYFAHGGNWFELVNKELNGTVGTGTETYDVGAATFSGDVSIADKIIHTGDTNTAIRFPAADTFTVETDGTERLRITSTGEVKIPDNGKFVAGAGDDLQIYHDGSKSIFRIKELVKYLFVLVSLELEITGNTETYVKCVADGK